MISCGVRILVVDNDQRVGPDLREYFHYNQYQVEFPSGVGPALLEEAKSMALHLRPHVVVSDLRLLDELQQDDHSGLDLLTDPCFASCGRILYSAYREYHWEMIVDAVKKEILDDAVGKEESMQELENAVNLALRDECACARGFFPRWPKGLDPDTVLKQIFGEGSDLPSDMVFDVLGRLFPEIGANEQEATLSLERLDADLSSASPGLRERSAMLRAWAGPEGPFYVKLGRGDATIREVGAYKDYVENKVGGGFHAHIAKHVVFWDVGATRYKVFGAAPGIKTCAAFYESTQDPATILTPLRHFFTNVWRPHYSGKRELLSSSLFDEYDRCLGLKSGVDSSPNKSDTLSFPGVRGRLPNPIAWLQDREDKSWIPTAQAAVTHGQLHAGNLLTDGSYSWVIDFERAGWGHILRDFVRLEHDIITRLLALPANDGALLQQLGIALTTPEIQGTLSSSSLRSVPEATKALAVVSGLREVAREVVGVGEMLEYYWALLLTSLHACLPVAVDSTTLSPSLLLASVICSRIDNWSKPWPPRPPLNDRLRRPQTESFQYDLFISYSHEDKEWVREWLWPELEKAGLKVCIDARDFTPGAHLITEMERAVVQSRRSLLVLTEDYLQSEWAGFESLLAHTLQLANREKRIVPLLLRPCEPPPRIRTLIYADFSDDPYSADEIARLVEAIRP